MARIDDIVEDFAALWRAQAGFNSTTPRRDRQGWDHFFEFSAPRLENSAGPYGSSAVGLLCEAPSKRYKDVKTKHSRKAKLLETSYRRRITVVLFCRPFGT